MPGMGGGRPGRRGDHRCFATVELNSGPYAGIPADWWVLAAPAVNNWYYLNGFLQWIPVAPGDLNACRPVYQGALFDLPEMTAPDPMPLPAGIYYPISGSWQVCCRCAARRMKLYQHTAYSS